MKIAIISDIHNNLANLEKVINYCNNSQINTIICCGDLASYETLDFLCEKFPGHIFYCYGNMDNDQLLQLQNVKEYKNATIFSTIGKIDIENTKIAFVHFPKVAKELCEKGIFDYVFYGHTHKPWQESIDKCYLINPGNVAGEIFPPTFATLEDGKLKLIMINELK